VLTDNKATVEQYMAGFRSTDRELILSCLTDDVVWTIPGMFEVRGKPDFANHIVEDGFRAHPVITLARLTEENDVVVAEGTVRTERTDGTVMQLAFCDVFEMRHGRIARLISYIAPTDRVHEGWADD
jgi:ketosteroid isomerase-like protein